MATDGHTLDNTVMWNPWHGCHRVSEGCLNCYMYGQDKSRGIKDSNIVKKTGQLKLPMKRHRDKSFYIKSNTLVMVCMTSDFFVEEADNFRDIAWEIMKYRSDVLFMIPTKRPERVENSLPIWWNKTNGGLNNVWLNVSTENQEMADTRIPILLRLPFKYKGIMASPLLENIDIADYLKTGWIDEVSVAGENYKNAREFNFDWAIKLREQCILYNTTFSLFDTGSNFIKDGKRYNIPINKQKEQAKRANIDFQGRGVKFNLTDVRDNAGGQESLFVE